MKPQLLQLKQKAIETSQQAAEAVSSAAIWAFVALVPGVITPKGQQSLCWQGYILN